MDPIRLQIDNFCGYVHSDILFKDFSSVLILGKIRGNDKLSNGAGKSTIFNAIKYALFNEVSFSTLEKIIRHGTNGCRVLFEFRSSVDGEVYRIVRSKNKGTSSDLRLYRNNNQIWEDLTQVRNSETDRELERILNINYKTFCNSVLFSQLDPTGLASMRPADRKKILKEVLQLGVYSKYEALVKKKALDIEKKIDENRIIGTTIGQPETDVVAIKKELDEINTGLDEKKLDLKNAKTQEDTCRDAYEQLSSKITNKEKQVAEYYSKKNTLISDIEKTRKLIDDYNVKLDLITKDGKLMSGDMERITNNIKSLQDKAISAGDIEALINKSDIILKNILDKKSQLNSTNGVLTDLRIPMPKGKLCKYCRHEITDSSREDCQKSIDTDIINAEASIQNITADIKLYESQYNDIVKNIKAGNKILSDATEQKSILTVKSKEIEIKRKLYSEYNDALSGHTDRLGSFTNELDVLKKAINDGSKEQFVKDKEEKQKHYNRLVEISKTIEKIRESISDISNKNAVLNEKLNQRSKDIQRLADIRSNVVKLEQDLMLHQKVVQAFGPNGIPALITHSVLDDLQIESNTLLAQFRPGLQIQFFVEKERTDGDMSDTLGINFLLDGFELEYNQLSGAQQLLASLALKLGLAEILKKRLGADIKLLLIDEVDASLDDTGLELFEKAIKLLQQNYKILIITHNNELKTRFQKAILVEQDDSFISTASVVNSW